MEVITSIPDGYECVGTETEGCWLAAVKVMPDVDREFLKPFNRLKKAEFHEGKTEADWSHAFTTAKRKLMLVRPGSSEVIAEADRLETPAICGGERPAVVWPERQNGKWRLMLWADGEVATVAESDEPIRAPAAAQTDGLTLAAYEVARDGEARVEIRSGGGEVVFSEAGRRPKMAAGPDDSVLLVAERVESGKSNLVAYVLEHGQLRQSILVPPADVLNFNPSVVWHPQMRVFCLAWESCPCWGLDERVGLHRDLSVWFMDPETSCPRPAPGTSNGFLRMQPQAFLCQSAQNLTPIQPRVFALGDSIALAFRRFRFTGVYPYGWDTFVMECRDGQWAPPGRISSNLGHPDVAYSVAQVGDDLIGFLPSCDYEPWQTFAEKAAGIPGSRKDMRAQNHRVEIVRFESGETLPPIETPSSYEHLYVIPHSVRDAAPDPPELPEQPENRVLIWGDLHAHCAYSKCMGCNDGLPQEVLRYQRNILGCRVLCLTDHVEYMSSAEFTHVMDCIEREADSGHIPLYGIEWARYPAHHTNFFARDREVFDRLRTLFFAHDHLTPLCAAIKKELPPASVVAIRHMHGENDDEFGVSGSRVTETHDPEVEWAMEGMQTRGNMMLDPPRSIPRFPSNFLDAGCQIGIIAGSDHSRGSGPNSFCLTGFWVKEPTAAGVFEAIRSRKTFGVASGKIAMYATLDGVPMGERVAVSSPVRVVAHVSSARGVRRVCLIRDGEVLEWQDVDATTASVELLDEHATPGRHWYCVTAEASEAYPKAPAVAHASPFFVEVS